MRLSTAADRDESNAVAVLHAAFAAGATLLDTADAYCLDDRDVGHNERLIARALAIWDGDAGRITVATKGGVVRPEGRWVPDGRGKHLIAACEASCAALGVPRVSLYQLHAPDPRVPFATSVRALASLQQRGLIERVGLSNATVGQIEEARELVDIVAVQIELSLWHDHAVLNGVVDYCLSNGIQLLAYRPLGGAKQLPRVAKDPVLRAIGERHDATPFEAALAWLHGISPLARALPGPTRIETVESIARAATLVLDGEDRAQLAERFPAARALARIGGRTSVALVQKSHGEVVLVMGLPGAGKSTLAASLVADGYTRLNRDEAGGSLRDLVGILEGGRAGGAGRAGREGRKGREGREAHWHGTSLPALPAPRALPDRVVLDNTYVSRHSRGAVVQAAAARGLDVRCVWLNTPIEDAQTNVVERLVSRYGHLPTPEELRTLSKKDVAAFGPGVLFRYQRELEPPDVSEGFSRVDVVPFARRPAIGTTRALLVSCDGVLLRSRSGSRTPADPDDVEVIDGRAPVLARYRDEGWRLLGISWQPEIAEGARTPESVRRVFARMNELLGLDLDVEFCPHAAGPPLCWCRKPLPGLGVVFIHRYALDPAQCIYVGSGAQDPGFARRLAFQYRAADDFFGPN